ncbi:MAG: LptE family protein [Burkholderiales bacterium]|nr:LptE family protein [Phycisphaerae bacterium]
MSDERSQIRQAFSLVAFLSSLVAGLTGCADYQQSGTGARGGYKWTSLYRQDVRTVAVPIFTNIDYSRGDEMALTKAIITQIEQRTPYKVVDREKADTVLEGQVTRVQRQTISSDRQSGLPQEQLYGIRVDFTWKDLRTGKVLVDRRDFDQTSPYYPTLGEGRSIGQLNSVEDMAVAIVHELEADW